MEIENSTLSGSSSTQTLYKQTDAARIATESPQGARDEATEDLEGIAGKAAQPTPKLPNQEGWMVIRRTVLSWLSANQYAFGMHTSV